MENGKWEEIDPILRFPFSIFAVFIGKIVKLPIALPMKLLTIRASESLS